MKKLKRLPTWILAAIVAVLVIVAGTVALVLTRAATSAVVINDNVVGTGANQWEYTGSNWSYFNDGGNKYMGDDHGSSEAGDYATLRFTGIKAEYFGAKSPQAGIVAISVDNGTETMVDLYSATRADNTLIFATPILTDGSHTLKIRLTGNKNPSASGAAAAVDRAVVTIVTGNSTYNSIEPENGTFIGGATTVNDTVASGGKAVQFKSSPTPPPPPPAGGLPTKVLSMWHHRWSGPNLSAYPTDVKNKINLYVLGLAQGCGGGCMEYTPANGQSTAAHAADIRALRAQNIHVLMGFGGSSATISISNASEVTQAFNSIVGFVNTYGISGIDIDLEPSGSSWNEQSLNSLAGQLKGRYGSNFIVGITPGLYDPHTARWLSLARLMGNNYDYMAPMLYDFPEAGDSRLTAVSVNKADVMVAGGVPANKMIMGYMARPDASYLNATPTPQLMIDAYRAVEAKYPTVRGFFIWEDKIMAARNWDFVRASITANEP